MSRTPERRTERLVRRLLRRLRRTLLPPRWNARPSSDMTEARIVCRSATQPDEVFDVAEIVRGVFNGTVSPDDYELSLEISDASPKPA